MTRTRLRLFGYGLTVALASGLLMILEIVAGRLIAPYVGVSLYTWTSVIGVILAGLSLGNWLGGVWADRGADDSAIGLTLAAAGTASFAVLVLLTLVAPMVQAQGLDLVSASFVLVLALFFIPAVLLGIVTPVLTTRALQLSSHPGRVVGRMHALAALGSIAGTFIAGYWLILYFGTRAVVVGTGATLLLMALPFLWARRRMVVWAAVLGIAGLAALTELRQGFANPCDRESQYYCVRVVDASTEFPAGRARAMVLDHLLHSINHESWPEAFAAPYVHLMDELVHHHLGPRARRARYFFAGGGAYTQPRAIRSAMPEARVTVAELDPVVTEIAARRLWVSTEGMRVLHMDARLALQRLADERFDVVIGDVFHDVAVPYHLVTAEFAQLVRSRLADDGLYLLNVVDAYDDPLLVKAIVKTLRRDFEHVHVWLEPAPEPPKRITFVISATDTRPPPAQVTARRGFRRTWRPVTEELLQRGTPLSDLPVLRDDFVPVERLVRALFHEPAGE